MNVSESPEGKIALQFSQLVAGLKCDEAVDLLTEEAKQTWNAVSIKENYQTMIEYFEEEPQVLGENMMETYSDEKGKYLYVPIQGDITSEAIIVGVNSNRKIFAIEWGRP